MVAATDDLQRLRHLIRRGQAAAAQQAFATCADSGAKLVEGALLSLLRFDQPADIETALTKIDRNGLDHTTSARWHLARGICSNRLRDPVAALAALSTAIDLARATQDVPAIGEALLERARVSSWMGSFARAHEDLAEAHMLSVDHADIKLPCLLRYADMYAEAERWAQAERFITRALPLIENTDDSIHVWQLLDCAARVAQARGKPGDLVLQRLNQDRPRLPPYLVFRLDVAMVREALLRHDLTAARALIDRLSEAHAETYEHAVALSLRGELALQSGDAKLALPLLQDAAHWFESRDLAVPRTKLAVLEADALVALGNTGEAARLLTRQRDYCMRRGLQLQREMIDLAQQRHGLPRMAEVEQGRVAAANAWSAARAYVIQERLGQGGQASVFRAHDTARDQAVAFKKLSLPPGPDAFRAVQHEVEALCRASVPGIARIIACGSAADGQAYLVQELIVGSNLRETVLATDAQRLSLFTPLAQTLDALHAKGLVHGDIKPENVIVSADGPVLVDFSAARFGQKRDHKNAATPAYLPRGWRINTMNAKMRDQYAFGLMLLEALTGTGPKDRETISISTLIDRLPSSAQSLLRPILKPLPFATAKPLYPKLALLTL